MNKKIISTEWAKPWLSLGIRAGPFLFTSGIMPRNYSTGEIVGGDIKAQTRQVLENIKNILEAGGTSLNSVVKVTVFLANLEDYREMNEVYMEFFGKTRPARSSCICDLAIPEAKIEMEVVALIP